MPEIMNLALSLWMKLMPLVGDMMKSFFEIIFSVTKGNNDKVYF